MKKVELEVNGRIVRVMEHCVDDIIRFYGGTKVARTIKNTPKELLQVPQPKEIIMPKEVVKPVEVIAPKTEIPEPVKVTRKRTKK